jgi:hypothetical protein
MRVLQAVIFALVAFVVVSPTPAQARPMAVKDGWLGLWCSDDDRVAVINYGVDPRDVLAAARAQLPEAKSLLAERTRLVAPRHNGACRVRAVGPIRVTTYGLPFNLWPRGSSCEGITKHVAWIGPRRVLDVNEWSCSAFAFVVTPSIVLQCGAMGSWDGTRHEYVLGELSCSRWGPPGVIGRFDGSMYAPDGSARPRDGFSLRYSERPGRCDPFIALPMDQDYSAGFAVERGRLVLRRIKPWDEPMLRTGIEWRPIGDNDRVSTAAFDFLGRGKIDAVVRVQDGWYSLRRGFTATYFLVVPGRGAELLEIGRQVRGGGGLSSPGPLDRTALVERLAQYPEVLLVDSTGLSDFRTADLLDVTREGGVTYTVLFRRYWWTKSSLALALSRVEKDGRQTPICLYDRSKAPPHAPW